MARVITFGEIMARICAPGFKRLRQSVPGHLDVTFAGSEANVAASLALLGMDVAFVSLLPKQPLANACIDVLRGLGIDTQYITQKNNGRLGLYFVETGANQRPSRVIYDRNHSSISLAGADSYDWPQIFKKADWFHVSGITPALSKQAAEATTAAVQVARQAEITISCDLNFRKKLWNWDKTTKPIELARKTMHHILPFVDIVIANEEDCADVLDIHAEQTDVQAGKLQWDRYPKVAQQVVKQFPNVTKVAITLRESLSATHNNWGGMLYTSHDDRSIFAPQNEGSFQPYQIKSIVDRVGGGDAFAAGLIYALNTPEFQDSQSAVAFAVAASCLAHSIVGDFNFSSRQEIELLMGGTGTGRVIR